MSKELLLVAQQRLQAVRDQLMLRTERFPEYGNYCYLQTWLLRVRGVALEEPLKMALPPLTTSMNN